jgi:hypothetical protein
VSAVSSRSTDTAQAPERRAPEPKAEALSALQFTQVAFAGHNRTEDLGDPAAALASLKGAFAMLAAAGVSEARLVTGLAAGADLLAARAWREQGLGPIHAVFPFLDSTLEPGSEPLMQSGTWLDGKAAEALGRNPHLAQTRWLIGAADLLVVVWTGEHARGAGGTADAVRLALEHGIPVLWVEPGDSPPIRLIRPEHLDEDFGFLEFLDELQFGREPLVRAATPKALHEALADLGLAEPVEEIVEEKGRRPPHSRTYAVFRRWLGGKAPSYESRPPPPDLMEQAGFQRLTRALGIADAKASELGALHRSHQIILLAVAIVMAIVGSSSALWPQLKVVSASLELLLAVFALLVWVDSERDARHERWGEARRLAEDLRRERVAWAIGVSTVPHGIGLGSVKPARRERRLAGLPGGAYDPDRVAHWGGWAVDELIAGQAHYHRGQALINGRIAHRVHQIENTSLGLLLTLLLVFVLAAFGMSIFSAETPHWLAGLVTMAGAVVPAIGAAGLALEATLAFGEQSQRSRVLAARLDVLAADVRGAGSLEAVQAASKAAMRLQQAQEDHWSEGAMRRRLFRGG